MKETDKAYLAGLLDGEGCIHIGKHTNRHKYGDSYALQISIHMCDGRFLQELQAKFGGSLTSEKRSLKNPKHSDILTWRFGARKAATLLQSVLPYLKLKRKQAELAIVFQNNMPIRGRGRYPVQSEEIEARKQAYNEMRELKFRERTYRLL